MGERLLDSLANIILDVEVYAENEIRNYVEMKESNTRRLLEEQKNRNTWKKNGNDVNNLKKLTEGSQRGERT